MNLLLAPHSDDEALFASYICLRHKPLVVVCLEGRRKRTFVPNHVRESETAAAMRLLGCDVRFLPVTCDPPDWLMVEELVRDYTPDRVWAPLPEPDGHEQHNAIGNLAAALWPGRVEFYSTYTLTGGRSKVGERVDEEPGWAELKQRALACYASQRSKPDTSQHFEEDLAEYVTAAPGGERNGAVRLNLASGPNPLEGFTNLDKQDGWLFEDGLHQYTDGSVEAITISHALMYVELDQWPAVFSELARVLKPRGVLRITEDSTGDLASSRQGLRHRASVATTPELVLEHMAAVGLGADITGPHTSMFHDLSLVQQNYGDPPDVFHVEGLKMAAA